MPLSLKQVPGRMACCLLGFSANLFIPSIADAQRYYSFTFFTGAAAQFYGPRNGLFTVSFPYRVVDASGTTTSAVFLGQKRNIYGSVRYFVAPFVIEKGWLHDVVHLGFGFSFINGSDRGLQFSLGYGRVWYVGRQVTAQNGPRSAADRRYAVKVSVDIRNVSEYILGGNNSLGSIDNRDKTIYLLGQEADSTFTVPATRSSPAQTYSTNTLDISYTQSEWSIMPKVSILPNPYRHQCCFELTIGYNLPLHDYGELSLIQKAGNASASTGGASIPNPSISASYNNQPLRSALYRFRGIYLGLALNFNGFARSEKK